MNREKKGLFHKGTAAATEKPEASASGVAPGEDCAEKADEILREYSREDNTRALTKVVSYIVNVFSLFISLFLVYTAAFGQLPAMQQRSLYLLCAMVILFLVYPAFSKHSEKGVAWYDYLFAAASLGCCLYAYVNYEAILMRFGISNSTDQFVFVILAILVLEGTRRLVSPALSLVTLVFLVYAYFGNYMPGMFQTKAGGLTRMADHMFMIPEGIFGSPLGTAATYVSLFVLFSALLQECGMGDFIQEIALALTGRSTGGPAKVAVVSSAAFGTISGAAAANVVGTGTFTIPLMKKCGYPAEFAGAVEACASTGGQLIPPVMGAACFIMAEYIGIPYSKIMLAGLIPGFLYYMSVFITVDLRSKKLGLVGMPKEQLPDAKAAMRSRGHLLIPFVAVIYLIIRQYTISFAALIGILLVIVISPLKKETRMSPRQVANAFVDGGKKTVSFGVSCACVGMIIGVTTLTGVGNVLGNYILEISQGNLLLTLILVMIMSIIMGMGMPTVAVYIVLATVAAPVLVKLGIPTLTAHFFCFYFGILACITPPVAVPSYAAAAIAGSNPSRTGWVAFKMAIPAFLIPYVFVYEPSMLLNEIDVVNTTACIFTAIIGVYLVAVGLEGYLLRPMVMWKRCLAFTAGIFCIVPEHITDLLGVAVLVFLVVTERRARKAELAQCGKEKERIH
ncbi:TRAP transporter permease [Oscillibacter sp.]|uniref:TRAP transporter permease n=1 Tax=Oscillibacter sp. TaxID=1945593 RepID=UPI00260DC198|nr:TRAP transporter permease [Oscillibacter sp.]MDD3347679.1 TRAP transporter permease [Oscillibacter sp.]